MARAVPLLPVELPEEPPSLDLMERKAEIHAGAVKVFERIAKEMRFESMASPEKLEENLSRVQFTEAYLAVKLPDFIEGIRMVGRSAKATPQKRAARVYEHAFRKQLAILSRLRRDLSSMRRRKPGFPIRVVDRDEVVVSPSVMDYDKPYTFDFQGATLVAVKTGDTSCDIYQLPELPP